ncbi:hypothetical protein AKJ08_0769 [Vulgatibacter incomptus]|uniref:Uncharacterized protein n=1 Tax=Vulgatibacter incomptus TaxID=1391653 RepID=A0A0K1PA52_9BACT|nr:hypothetical protein AKJ08_0769 [Vulgatibacter incomptus]
MHDPSGRPPSEATRPGCRLPRQRIVIHRDFSAAVNAE